MSLSFMPGKNSYLYLYIFFQCLVDGLVRKRSQLQIAPSRSLGEFRTLKKSSSCSTIYIDDSTVSQPNLKNTIKCVSLAIYYHIKNRKSGGLIEIFDENLHPLTVKHFNECDKTLTYKNENIHCYT